MPRLTITLSAERHQALKESAARRGTSMAALIEESLELNGVRTTQEAGALLLRARQHAARSQAEALSVALAETRKARRP